MPRTETHRGPRRAARTADRPAVRPTLVVVEPARAGTVSLTVRPNEPPEHLFRRLLGAYLAGAREFVLRERPGLRPATRDVIRSFCRRTRQPEIVSEEHGVVRLRDLAFENPVPLPQRIARMGRLVVEFHRDAVDSWSRLPFGADGAWERRDDEIDREAWYIQRLATLAPDPSAADVLGPFMVARSLERIADHAVVLGEAGRRLVDLPQSVGPITSLKQFHGQAMQHLEGVLAATDGAVANELLDTGEALMASGRALADRLLPAVEGGTMAPATAAAIGRILESIGRTIAYSEDIAQVVLDRSLPLAASEPRGNARRLVATAA
jgi:phosphate uptake regulator